MRASVIVAVLPEYRHHFLVELRRSLEERGDELVLVAGDTHLDATVRSGTHEGVVVQPSRHLMRRRLLWQKGVLRFVRGADVVVVDLNPRSITAWLLIALCKARGRRVLVWGHINPRQGPSSKTAPLRKLMREAADGVISYTWTDADQARRESVKLGIWVAANGLYPAEKLGWDREGVRSRALYVGRLEPPKKPALALEAFALAVGRLPATARLTFVGDGSLRPSLERRVHELGLGCRVDFLGHVGDFESLRSLYSETVVSLSPGYVGLSLTQSLGFGVPMIVADDEPHAPEVELLSESSGMTFSADDVEDLARSIIQAHTGELTWDHAGIARSIGETYSSTAMASGFELALRDEPQVRAR